MKPRKPLPRGKPPRRKKPLPKSTKALVRRALRRTRGQPKRFAKLRDPQYLEWIRGLPCLRNNSACGGAVEAAHVKSRGAGGKDVGNVVPLCHWHHQLQHEDGIKSFAELVGGLEELRRIAAEVYPEQYEKQKALGFPE